MKKLFFVLGVSLFLYGKISAVEPPTKYPAQFIQNWEYEEANMAQRVILITSGTTLIGVRIDGQTYKPLSVLDSSGTAQLILANTNLNNIFDKMFKLVITSGVITSLESITCSSRTALVSVYQSNTWDVLNSSANARNTVYQPYTWDVKSSSSNGLNTVYQPYVWEIKNSSSEALNTVYPGVTFPVTFSSVTAGVAVYQVNSWTVALDKQQNVWITSGTVDYAKMNVSTGTQLSVGTGSYVTYTPLTSAKLIEITNLSTNAGSVLYKLWAEDPGVQLSPGQSYIEDRWSGPIFFIAMSGTNKVNIRER